MKVLSSRQLDLQWYFSELYTHMETKFIGIFEF